MIRATGSRWYWVGGVAIALALIALIAAPASHRLNSGSTWGQAPDGYGAWYAYMQPRRSIERWQRPIADLLQQRPGQTAGAEPVTLIQVMPQAVDPRVLRQPWLQSWLQAGHTLIVLGISEPVTAAPFTTTLDTPLGAVTVQTRRRAPGQDAPLVDDYGAVVWRQSRDTGQLILATTPFLAANAYQQAPGNFAFLASLTAGDIYMDEYLHGYRDPAARAATAVSSWLDYLAQTPLLVIALQGLAVVGLVLLAQNRRPGIKRSLPTPQTNDSQAYIDALAGVLQRADSRDFLVATLVRSERQALQQALGLGGGTVSDQRLRGAWQQSTGEPAAALAPLQGPAADQSLGLWLQRLQALTALARQRKSSHE